ncbi:MAG: tetratricopeptide repeat protein [Thermogutta sp.]
MDKALALAQEAYDRLPNRAELLDPLGHADFKKGLFTRALWCLSEARTKDAANPWAAYHLGLLCAAQNEADQARLHLQEGLGLPPAAAAQANAILSQLTP